MGCEEIDWPFGPLAKLLLLTLQRRDEVAGMEWLELNLGKRRHAHAGRQEGGEHHVRPAHPHDRARRDRPPVLRDDPATSR
jgi:hypothetical protein